MAWRNGVEAINPPRCSNGWTGPRKRSATVSRTRAGPRRLLPAEVLAPEEVRRLIAACSRRPAGIRNRALIVVLYRAGLRITEALSLRPKDLDPERGAIRVLHAKGGRSRTVGMDAEAFAVLARWMEIRLERGVDPPAPVFCMLDARPVTSSYIRVLFPRLGRRAGIAKRVHAHGLRHTHAAELRGEGIDIGIISKQLGHRSIIGFTRTCGSPSAQDQPSH